MSTSPYAGIRIITPEDQAALVLSNSVRHIVGLTPALIERDSFAAPYVHEKRTLYLAADVGSWRVRPGDYIARTFDQGDITDDTPGPTAIAIPDHGYETGEGPFRITTDGGTIATGLAVDTDYWIIRVDDDTIQFAASLSDAEDGTPVDISAANTESYILGAAGHGSTPASDGYGWAGTLVPTVDSAAASDDYNSILIGEGFTAVVAAPSKITVVGFDAGDVLTYWWS